MSTGILRLCTWDVWDNANSTSSLATSIGVQATTIWPPSHWHPGARVQLRNGNQEQGPGHVRTQDPCISFMHIFAQLSCLCHLLRLWLWGDKQHKPLENMCACLYDISAAILWLLCFGYLPPKWMAFKLLQKRNDTFV